ncbi:conserved Plasmodium protein, unknown function [Plasmodium malariae]|uniref:Uncharacterized protein n=1 Tax=Plasmodium malariae TaxID=5858 RepID=A0A1C3L0F0_PLAMA|nr:conserved Plasmodium protein, unknown function [Plasmodium malariae]
MRSPKRTCTFAYIYEYYAYRYVYYEYKYMYYEYGYKYYEYSYVYYEYSYVYYEYSYVYYEYSYVYYEYRYVYYEYVYIYIYGKKKKKKHIHKLFLKKGKNVKSNEENLNEFQNIIKDIKHNFSTARRNELDIKNMSKINKKIQELNQRILGIKRNNDGSYNDNVDSKKDLNAQGSFMGNNSSSGIHSNSDNNKNNSNNNNNISNCLSTSDSCNKYGKKCSLSISNFYNFNFFSKKEEKVHTLIHDLHIDNDVSWIPCITQFANSLENTIIKGKKEELIKKKKKKRKINVYSECKKMNKSKVFNSKEIEMREENIVQNGGEINAVVHSEEQPMFTYESEKSVEGQNERYVSSDSHEKNKYHNNYVLDSNILNILMMNFVENVKINCTVNFDVLTFQIWDSNTAYNRCSLNFVIEYIYINFYTLSIYEKNVNCKNNELFNVNDNSSAFQKSISFNRKNNGVSKFSNIPMGSNGEDAPHKNNKSFFLKRKYPSYFPNESSKMYSFNNNVDEMLNSSVSNVVYYDDTTTKKDGKKSINKYIYSKSAVEFIRNTEAENLSKKCNMSMMGDTMTDHMNNVNNNMDGIKETCNDMYDGRLPIFNSSNNNNFPDTNMFKYETLNMLKKERLKEKEDNKGLGKLFNWKNFFKNIEQFKIEIMNILKRIFFRKKVKEELEVKEGEAKEKGKKITKKKYENCNDIFMKNNFMFNDIKNYNENKVSKNIECKVEFLIYCENFNKKENSYQTFIEPMCTEIIAVKKDLNSPIHIYYYFSWLNINFNFNFLDNILSLCCSVIFSMITQRTRLLLGRHMYDVDRRKNHKIIMQSGRNEKLDDVSSRYPHTHHTNNNTIYHTEYDDNNTERKNVSEMDDTHTSMYFPNYYASMNEEQYRDLAIITNENVLFRYNKFDVLNSVNRSLDTYIFGEFILEKLLRNYQYSCQYPGDYLANQISNTHELKNSIDIELYPLTLLLIINNLDNKYIKPEINVLFILTSANRKEGYENYHKKFLFNVENFEFLKKYNILKKRKNNLVHIKSREQSDTLNFGNIKQKLKFLVEDNFFYPKRENNIYCNELNDIVSSDPSIYLRYDNQLYTILEKPDHRLFLHNCAYSIFNINGKIINSFVDDYYHFTDKRAVLGKKKKSTFSFKRKEYFLELGAKYCNDILDNYTTHTNVFLDIQLEKTLSFVITKSGKSSEIQGYSLVLNPMKIVSELTPRLVSYEETLDAKKKNIYDSFFVQFDGIKIKRILNWQHAARNYKTYLDDHFIKPYRNLFHSKNKAFSLTKKDAPDKFSFILNRTKNRAHWGNQKEKAEGSKAEGITNDGHDRNYYNKLRSSNKADVYSDAHKGIYNDDCNDVHKDLYNDGYSDGCNEIRSTFYLSSDGNMSEIFNLKIRKKSSFSDCSSYEYNGNEGTELLRRASSCPATKIGKASIMSQIDIDDINRKKGLSYNVKEYKKKKNYKEENNNFFFFNTCATECEEREGQEIVINTDIYKKHKKSWNKRITNANSANYFTHNHNDKIYNNNSNYVLSMSDKTSCTIHLCHIKFNPTYPMFIVKLNEENLYVNVCDYDVEFFFLIFSDVYEHYNMQELMYKKNNILFLKKKIKSISKLNKKYYNNTLINSSGNRTLFKKGFYRNRSTKKKSTSEMKGNYAEDANSKIKKQKDSSRNEKCSIVEDHGVMKQKKGIKTEGKNKKIYIKKEQLLETNSQEKYSIFCLKEDEKDQVIDFNKNTKKEELLKNKHERHKRKTYVGYMSDANLRGTKELSIREVKNALVQKNDKEDIFPKCRKCNSNTIFGSHAKYNLNLDAIKDKNDVNNLRKNEKNGNEREHCDNVDASLYDDEKSNISNENDEYIIKLNDNPDVLVLSNFFFFNTCATECEEREGQEIVINTDIYKKHKKSWNKRITNANSANYFTHNHNDKIYNNNSNYVLSMSDKTSCTIHLCHIKFNPTYPMFIVKLNEENLYVNVCDYDVEFFFLIFSDVYEHYNMQELMYKKNNILFLKKKIKSISKLNKKYYNNTLINSSGNRTLFKKGFYRNRSTKKKSTSEMKGNYAEDANSKIKKQKDSSRNEKCSIVEDHGVMKQKKGIKTEGKNKKIYIKKEQLLETNSQEKYSIFCLKEDEKDQVIDFNKNTKKEELLKNKHERHKRKTYVGYMSDANLRGTKELSIREVKNALVQKNDKEDIFPKCRKCNSNTIFGSHAKYNLNLDAIKDKNDVNNLRKNEKNGNEREHCDNVDASLYDDEKSNISNENDEYIIKLNDNPDVLVLSSRKMTALRGSYHSNATSAVSDLVHDHSHERSSKVAKVKKKKRRKNNKQIGRKADRQKVGRTDGQLNRENPHFDEDAAKSRTLISSDDDSWVDLLENYDSNESLDDNEKKKVQNMLVDVESIKKRLSANNNFMITCSLSLNIKKIFVRLWKRKSPLKKQNKASNLDDLNISNSFQFIDKYTYSGRENRKNTTKKHNSSTHLNINNQQDDYKIGEEQDGYNFTSLLREDDMNLFQNKERNNITQEENEDEFLLNKNFITLNENLQKNMFNNMQYAVPLYTIIFSDICFVAKVEKNYCAYVLYSMNNVDIRDETNITLLSMSSIYHGDPKCSDKSVYFTCKKLMDVEKEQVINYEERKTKDSTIIKNEYNNNTLETDDTYLDYSISNIDLPDLNKTHFVLLYFGYLFKNNHTFKFILNRTKVKIFWEIIDELMSWIVNINELLPKIHTVELDTITKLNNSENKHLDYYLQKIQYINYDNVYFKQNDLLSALSLKRVYKVPITSFMNYYALEFQKEIADNQIESNECNTSECVKIENSGIYNKYIIDYTDMYDDPSDDVCIITDDTLVCNNLKNVILVDTNINVNRTIKEILFYENYFFNYSFNKINKKIDIEKIISGDNTKDTIYYKDKKTIHKKEKKYLNNSAKSFPASLHSATTSHVTNNELIKKKNHLEHFLVDTERQVSFDHLTDELNCQYCCHSKNLHYTAYTKEICRAYAYPYIHVDVEINYFEFWISLDPIRIPQKRNTYLMSDARSNNMYYSRGKRSKRIRRSRKNLEQKWKKKSNSISSRSLRSTKGRHMKESASFSYYEKVQDGAGIENWEHVKNVEHREGGMDSKDGGEASSRKKTKFHEKIRHYKNMNIEKPYVLATKGCIKSVIFFLLYNDQKSDKREELSDEDCRKEDEHNINTSKLKRHVVSTKLINLNKKNEHAEELKNKVTEMMNYSNLSNVLNAQDFFKSKFIQWLNSISCFLPCVVNISIFLSQITSAIAKPVATNPFLKAYIDWNNVPYNNILLQPCRGKLNFEMKIPSSEILVERFLGINKITSLKFFKKNNLLYKNVVEGIDLNFYFEPVVVNIDSSTLTLLYQLYNIILDFCNYSMKFYSTKSKEDEEELMYRVNVHDDTYYDNWAEFIINDSFYLNVYDTNSCIDSCEYSAYINDELISDNTDLDRELNSYKYNEKNKLFANFFLKPPNNMHSKGLNEEKLSHGEFNKDILNTEQNEKKEIEMREENIVQNGGEINAVVHSEEQPMFTYESEKSVEGQNERYVSSDSHEKNKYHNNYVLDSNILNILMMNFVENVKINCTVNFDVLTFQIWDSNTAYNRCSLNFVIEYIYINFYTLSIYEKNVNCKNNELFNVNDNSSAFQKSISFNRKNNGVSKFSNIPMGSNGEDAPHKNNKSFFLKRKYPSYFPNESSKMYSFNNNVDEMLNSSVSNVVYYDDTTTKKDGKKSINKYIYSKSAVEFIRNTEAENLSKKCNMSMMGDTMTDHMNNVNNNMDGIKETCNDMYDGRLPIFNSSNNNNFPDTNMFKYETLNMLKKERLKEKEDNKGLGKLFNWKNFFKNIEQFKIEIMNILKRIFFRKKVKEELEVKEGEAKEKGKKITKKKYENCNDIFMKNNFMFNDIKNYNENKVSKNIECKVEFLIYCENFNKKENSYQTFIEPMCTEIIAVKKDLNSPIHIYYYFSWLNINFNFNFLDNILSLCCSVIFSMITQRTRLLLGRHMYYINFYTLSIYEKNVNCKNNELFNVNDNSSAFQKSISFNRKNNGVSKFSNIPMGSNGEDAPHKNNKSFFLKRKYPSYFPNESSKMYSFNNNVDEMLNSSVSNVVYYDDTTTKKDGKKSINKYIYSKSAVEFIRNTEAENLSKKCNMSMMGDTMTDHMNNVNNNMDGIKETCNDMYDGRLPIFNSSNNNNFPDTNMFKYETLNMLKKERLKEKEDNKGLGKLFNWKNFFKNIEQFKIEIMNILKRIFFRKKVKEELEVKEGEAKEKGKKITKKKYENCNDIFMKNNFMFNDIKNYNENKVSKNIECKVEFLIYCENFNKKENSYQTFIEPMCTEIIAVKKDLNSPIHIYYYFSWLNINFNFNFLDNILSLCCSVIFSMITQRTRLLLGRHMYDVDRRKNHKIIMQSGRNEKLDDVSSRYPHTHHTNNNTIYHTEYDDNNTERKNVSEMDDTHTSMYFPNYYASMNEEQYRDLAIITNENVLFRYNKFDVLNSVNRSLDTYIFGEFILEKLLRNYQYSCQYPGDYLAKSENEYNLDKSQSPSEQLLHIKLFNFIKKNKRLEMNNICKINNLLGQPVAICTVHEKNTTPNADIFTMCLQYNSKASKHAYDKKKQSVSPSPTKRFSKGDVLGNDSDAGDNSTRNARNAEGEKKKKEREKEKKKIPQSEIEYHDFYDLSDNENDKRKSTRQSIVIQNEKNAKNCYYNSSYYTDSSENKKKQPFKYQWKIISNNESLDLPTYENGKVKFFLIRFRLLNYIYDIPSSILNTESDNEDVLRIVIPERRLPPNINKQVEQDLYNDELLEIENKASSHNTYHTIYPTNYTSRRYNTSKDDTWKASNIPQPRNHLFIFFRTSSRISHEEKQEYDFFISSIVAVKNNTDFPLYIFKSVPGNANKRSIFREYYHKYNMMPSPPPTYTLKIDKKLEKFIERKINTNNPLKHKGRKMNKDQDELNAGISGGKKKRLHKYAHVGNNNSNIYADNYGDNYVNNNGNNDGCNYGTNNNNYNSSHVNCDAYTKANYTQSKSYVYGRKFINNIFPLMKMSSIEHYISGDIKFSSLATVKYKKKRKGKKRLKHELQKKLIKKKIKEIYIKSIWKKTKRKKISKYENTVPYDDKCRKILTSRNAYRNIMSINDSFFSFAKKSSSSSKKLSSEFAHIISDLSNITLSSLSSSLFSLDTSQSNSSVCDNSLYDYDMDNCEEQALLNEYFNKHSENKGNLDIIEISNNSNKLIPIPLYWLVAENSFIWLSIQNEKIYNCDLYDFLCREKNADYICTKSTLDNMLNYQSPFVADSLKLFKPYLIRLKNLLLKENKMAQKRNNNKNNQNSQNSQNSQISKNGQNSQNGQNNKNGQYGQNRKNEQSNRNRQNLLNSYNMNYMNLKEVYFTSTIISVYNPNYVLHKKDAHNFYQINIEHALMINNALPKTMYLNYEIFKDKSKKDSHRSVSTYGSFHFTDKSNTYETTLNTGQSYSLESSCSCSSYDEDESTYRRYDTTSKDKEENNKSNYQGGRKEQHKMQSYDRTDKLRKMQSEQEDIRLKGSTNMEENAVNEYDKKEHVPIEQSNKVNRKNEKRITMLVDKLSTNTWKGMNKFNRMSGTTIGKDYNKSESKMMASNMTSDKQLLIRELNTNRNVFIYKNIKKNEKDTNKENMKSKTYVEEVNFTVMIKKETNKNIYVIRINPGQSIKLPFVPSNVNISFDGYYSKNISINYPHKKGREKIILEKEVKEEMSSFFTLDYNERDDRTSKNNEHTNSTYGKNCSDYTDADRINNTVEGADRKEQRDYRNNEYSKPITLVNRIIKDKGNYENVKNLPWKNEDKVVRKYAKYKSSNYEQFQNQLTIWAIFNEFYETGKNRYQDISLEKVHHGSYAVSCTFFVSACVINRLNYPIKIKRLNNDNTVVVEPYVRKLLPCEFAQRRNKLIISYETLKEIKNWVNYPLKNCMIKRKKLSKTRNKINKKNNKMGLRNRKNFNKAPNSQIELETNKEEGQGMGKMKQINPNSKNEKNGHNSETLEGKDKILDSNDKAQDASNEILEGNDKKVSRKFNLLSRLRNGKKTRCLFYRNNINKPLESEDFRITDLSTTRLVCSNKNKNIPQLKYSIYMSIAPMPFFRTTVMEILPYIVIINNTKMNIVFQEFIKNYTYFKYNSLEPGAYVEFHPQSKKKVMLKICGIFQNSFNFLIDDYLEKELYLENLERENEKVLDGLKQHDPASKNCTSMKVDDANKGNNVNSDNNSNNANNTSNNNTSNNNVSNNNVSNNNVSNNNVSNNNVSNNNDNNARVENNDFLNISQKLSALIGMGKSNHINSSKNVHMAEGQNNAHNSNISHDTLNVHSSSNNNSKERRGTSINSSNSVKHSLDIQESIINGNSFVASNNNVKKYKYIDEFRFLYWSEVLDLTRVSMVYFRHPVISDENFKKEEKKLRKFNLLLKKHRGNDDIYLDMSKELIKGNNIPYEYTCCSMEISTFKGCKFVRFQDIDVVPYYLINLTKYNIKLRQVGIYEHSEVLHKIPKKKKKTFDEIFKNYAFNFSFYNPYKDPKLKVSILISNKKNEKSKKQKKLIRRKKNLKFRYSNSLIENLKNELNYLTFLATNYLTANEDVKVINDKIFRLKKFSEQVENLNDGNVNIMDLGNSNNVTLLKLKDGDTFVFILCTKKTYNGKTIFSFETYDDLISNVLNFSNSSYHHKQSYKLRKSFHHLLSTQMNRVYFKNRSKRKKNSNKSKNMKDLKKKKESQNFWYLINLFKKKSTARPMEKDPRISNIIADLYEKKIINRQEKKKKFTLNLNIFAHFIFKGLGLSINNYNLEEILYFSMEYILIIYKQINDKELFHINVGWLQIDNHTKNTDYKNVLLPIVDLKKKNETYNSFNTHEKMCESTNETFEKLNKSSTFFKQMKYNSNDTFSYFMKDKSNNISKNNSDNMLNSLHSYKKKSFDSYFENDNLLISTNINNPLCNSYKIFIPSFFYSEYNSILNIVIIKQKRGNMKNFLELSDVSIKISPMSINIDSYFIIEILKIFDELLKIMEFDLSDYNSLNLEKNIELRDNDFDSLEYKKNIGPLEELIKHYILKDYYLYEQIANFKFSSIKDVGKMNDNNLFHSSILYNRNSTDVLDLKAYITMIKEYKTVEQRSTKNTDQLMKDGNHLDTIMLSPLCIENAGKNKHLNFGISNNSLISKQSTKRSPSNDVLVERNDTFFSAHNGSSLCSSKMNDERTPQKDQIYKLLTRNKTEEDNIMNSIYNSDVFNEDKMSYLQNCEKYYKHLLNNRKRILKKIQNINLKNSLISFDKLFISKLEINEIKLIINIKNRSLSYDKKSEIMGSNVMNALVVLIMNIPNISDAHLHFEKEVKKNMCGSLHALIFNEVMNDYINPGMNQMFNVLGAIDFIGNPLIIYKRWKKGYHAFIKDLKKSVDSCSFPLLFCILLLNIIGKFGKSLLSGVLEGVSRLCGSWSTCFERFSRNADNYSIVTNTYILQSEILDQPSNCAEGICYGCHSFLNILTISCVNTLYKPFVALKKSKGFRKNEKDKCKIFLSALKVLSYGLFSGLSSLFFGFFNSILSFFTFLFIGTLNQIQTLTMKSVVRPKKMSVIKEYAKFVNYEYPLSFSNHVINEKKKKKELLKKNIVAIILLYTIRDNNPSNIKSFLWVSNKEVGYCQKDKLLWSLYINCIIKVDILLIQVDSGGQVKKHTIFNRSKNDSKRNKSNFNSKSNCNNNNSGNNNVNEKKKHQHVKTKWKFPFLLNPQKYRQFGDFKPSYYIRILYRSLYKVKKRNGGTRIKYFSLNKKGDYNYRLKKILRKNTYEKYFEKEFKKEHLTYHDSDSNSSAGEEQNESNKIEQNMKCTSEKLKRIHTDNRNDKEKDTQHYRNIYDETLRYYSNHQRGKHLEKMQNDNDRMFENSDENKRKELKKKHIYQYKTRNLKVNDKSRCVNKLEHEKKNTKKNHVHKKKKYLYISKLVKCESKEVALQAFSLLLSFLLHKSPYYLKTTY